MLRRRGQFRIFRRVGLLVLLGLVGLLAFGRWALLREVPITVAVEAFLALTVVRMVLVTPFAAVAAATAFTFATATSAVVSALLLAIVGLLAALLVVLVSLFEKQGRLSFCSECIHYVERGNDSVCVGRGSSECLDGS